MLAALLLLGQLSSGAPPLHAAPEARWEEGSLRVQIPSRVLLEPEVRRVIQSGLTVSFLLDFVVPSARVETHGRIDVRYEPWDDVYLASMAPDDNKKPDTLASFAALVEWWEARRWTIGVANPGTVVRVELKITVTVVPFSASEERDARRWFARSIDEPAGSASVSGGPGESRTNRSDVLAVVISTAIKRRAVRTFRWTVTIPEPGRP